MAINNNNKRRRSRKKKRRRRRKMNGNLWLQIRAFGKLQLHSGRLHLRRKRKNRSGALPLLLLHLRLRSSGHHRRLSKEALTAPVALGEYWVWADSRILMLTIFDLQHLDSFSYFVKYERHPNTLFQYHTPRKCHIEQFDRCSRSSSRREQYSRLALCPWWFTSRSCSW